jgi:hypothetical protein
VLAESFCHPDDTAATDLTKATALEVDCGLKCEVDPPDGRQSVPRAMSWQVSRTPHEIDW